MFGVAGWVLGLMVASPQGVVQSSTVTYECPGARLEVVLKELSERSKLHLQATTALKNEIVVVRLSRAPIVEAMDRIAWVEGATWVKEGGIYYLKRTSTDVRALEKRSRANAIAELEPELLKARKRGAELGDFDEVARKKLVEATRGAIKLFNPRESTEEFYEQASKIAEGSPSGRVLSRIVAQLSAEDLVSIPMGTRQAYSDHPNSLQRPLSKAMLRAVSLFFREQEAWVETVSQLGLTGPQVEGATYELKGITDVVPVDSVAKTLVTVTHDMARWGSYRVGVSMWSRAGKRLGDAATILRTKPIPTPPLAVSGDDPMVSVSGDSLEIAKAFRSRNGETKAELAPETLKKLVRPEVYDPVALTSGIVYLEMAKARGVNLVMAADDSDPFLPAIGINGQIKSSVITQRMGIQNEVVESGGWLCSRPKDPLLARMNVSDRTILGEYLRHVARGAALSVDQQAYYWARLANPEVSFMPIVFLAIATPGKEEPRFVDFSAARIYGLLTPEQKENAKGAGLSFRELTPEQLERVQQLLVANFDVSFLQEPRSGAVDLYSLRQEPTEILPGDWLQSSVIRVTQETRFIATTPNGMRYGARDLASALENIGRNPDYSASALDQLRLVTEDEVTLRFVFGGLTYQEASISGDRPDRTPMGPYSALPAAFRAQVEEAREEIKRFRARQGPGNPPPPRR